MPFGSSLDHDELLAFGERDLSAKTHKTAPPARPLPDAAIANTLMQYQQSGSQAIANALITAVEQKKVFDQANTTFAVIQVSAQKAVRSVVDLEDLPVLAQAVEPEVTPEPVVEEPAAKVSDESKAYYYRGAKYYRD